MSDEAGSIYVATGLSQHTASPEETEQLQIKKMPFDDVFTMVMKGEITDMLSVTAVLKVKHMLLNGDLQATYQSVK